MMVENHSDELNQVIRDRMEAIKSRIREANALSLPDIQEIFSRFLTEDSCFDEIRWRQYTPHFNDGDQCVFSVGDFYFRLKNDVFEELREKSRLMQEKAKTERVSQSYNTYDYIYDQYVCYDDMDCQLLKELEFIKKIKSDVDELRTLSTHQWTMLVLFGDGYEVKVTSSGIRVLPYTHD